MVIAHEINKLFIEFMMIAIYVCQAPSLSHLSSSIELYDHVIIIVIRKYNNRKLQLLIFSSSERKKLILDFLFSERGGLCCMKTLSVNKFPTLP
jgi:hypothetical protein